jgi:hypothetical protein
VSSKEAVVSAAAGGVVSSAPLLQNITNTLGATGSSSSSKGALLVEALAGVWGRLSAKVRSALAKAAAKAAKGGSALLKGLKALIKKIIKGLYAKKTQE